jgi:beta-aspartyl-peptidase (threonine type)
MSAASPAYSLAIHAGAGTLPHDMDDSARRELEAGLADALATGERILSGGGSALDAVEMAVRAMEDNPRFNAGRGAVFTRDATHELDASIMNGADLRCGSVAGITMRKNPIQIARLVMERSQHVLLAGAGAEAFADSVGVERVAPEYFHDEFRHRQLQQALERDAGSVLDHVDFEDDTKSTVGAVARDTQGDLAAATSTGGMTAKLPGRVGDSPIIGAGTYADNRTCAISCTGKGEEFIRYSAAFNVHARMMYGDLTLEEAARRVIANDLARGDGGLIGIDRHGNIVLEFNTDSMLRAAVDASGKRLIGIWGD